MNAATILLLHSTQKTKAKSFINSPELNTQKLNKDKETDKLAYSKTRYTLYFLSVILSVGFLFTPVSLIFGVGVGAALLVDMIFTKLALYRFWKGVRW